jgi:glycosyltransferase involved in cell wall biosynthesis
MVRTAVRLARKSVRTMRHEGWRGFYAKARAKLFPPKAYRRSWRKPYAAEALTLAQWLDFTPEELQRSQATMAAHPGRLEIRTINWYLPHFEHVYYGGLHTILRFADGFRRHHGVSSAFIVLGGATAPPTQVYRERIAAAFPALAESPIVVRHADRDLVGVRAADACVATFWSTAYYVLKFNQTRRKFYFLQDFEPMFYPAGSISAQVEASYRFGFYGLANTVSLQQIYQERYQGRAAAFEPCVDCAVFYPLPDRAREWPGRPYTVFFYARPDYWRNGFELGTMALRKLKQQFGECVRIVAAGQRWKPSDYGLAGGVENLGLLSYQETAALYRACDVGLVLMFTQHPSYLPLELMASGCLVVSNLNSATAWLLADGENCLLALPSASCIAATIARALQDEPLRWQIAARALQMVHQRFADWDRQIERMYAYMCDPEGTG